MSVAKSKMGKSGGLYTDKHNPCENGLNILRISKDFTVNHSMIRIWNSLLSHPLSLKKKRFFAKFPNLPITWTVMDKKVQETNQSLIFLAGQRRTLKVVV